MFNPVSTTVIWPSSHHCDLTLCPPLLQGVKAEQQSSLARSLEARLRTSEDNAELMKSFSSPQVIAAIIQSLTLYIDFSICLKLLCCFSVFHCCKPTVFSFLPVSFFLYFRFFISPLLSPFLPTSLPLPPSPSLPPSLPVPGLSSANGSQ